MSTTTINTRQPQSGILPMNHTDYAAQLFRTSLFSDCTIRSNHRIWHLHRCILSPRCEFFWGCFQGSFEEASSASVEMHDDDPETLERMLRWIYQLEYPATTSTSQQGASWTADLMLYMMADKYGLTTLMDATREALLRTAEACVRQEKVLVDSVEDFSEATELLFAGLPERDDLVSLRGQMLRLLAPTLAKNMRTVPALEELMADVPGFSLALVEALAQQKDDRRSSASSTSSLSVGGSSNGSSAGQSPRASKPHIPLNEDSDDEY